MSRLLEARDDLLTDLALSNGRSAANDGTSDRTLVLLRDRHCALP
jgi:hypothetical protein